MATLSSIGMPGLNGFVGEFLILLGAYRANWLWATVAGTAVILSAVYMLWMFQRVNYGTVTNPKNEKLPDLLPREWAALGPVVALAVLMGVVLLVYSEFDGPNYMVLAFLALFFAGEALHVTGEAREWHRKYLDYRALAEGLPVQL